MQIIGFHKKKGTIGEDDLPINSYSHHGILRLTLDDMTGKVYLIEGNEDTVHEVELSYNVTDRVYGREVRTVPYFKWKGQFYEVQKFKTIASSGETWGVQEDV